MVDPRQVLGAAGEEQAARWYQARGYQVLARNWRCRDGELDLVVRRRSEVAFVEVKTRRSARFGHPVEAVTGAKQDRIRRLALTYLQSSGTRARSVRFDVVSILGTELEVLEAAF